MSTDDLARRLGRLEAIEAVRELLARYAAACDRLQANDLTDLFTEDAVLTSASRYEGRTAIIDYYDGVLSSLVSARHHVINSAIELETPDRATHRAYFLAFLTRDSGPTVVLGDYLDVVVRGTDDVWRFREKGNFGAGSIPLSSGAAALTIEQKR